MCGAGGVSVDVWGRRERGGCVGQIWMRVDVWGRRGQSGCVGQEG